MVTNIIVKNAQITSMKKMVFVFQNVPLDLVLILQILYYNAYNAYQHNVKTVKMIIKFVNNVLMDME